MHMSTRLITIAAMLLALGLAGCGDTWRGIKQDTSENLEAAGAAIENAGKDMKE